VKKLILILLALLIVFPLWSYSEIKFDKNLAMEHVRFLASDDLKGRKSGTPEYITAAEYVAEKMKAYGLEPAGETGSYFQQVEFKNWRHFEAPARLEVIFPEHRIYTAGRGRDFLPNSGTGSGIIKGNLVFAGYGLVSEKYQWDDYKEIDVKNKIVLILPGAPDFLKDFPKKDSTLDQKAKTAVEKGASGIVFMNVDESLGGRSYFGGLKKDTCPEGFVVLTAEPHVLDELFYMVDSSWRMMVSRTLREKKSITLEMDAAVEMEAHHIWDDRTAPSVLGLLPGQDPELKNEFIIIGGHLDHLGVGLNGEIYNGADDNAASVAVILELARAMNEGGFVSDRSIIFAAWAGEEIGLVGSRYYAKNPLYPLEKTVVYMNMDMIGCGDGDLYVGGMWEFSDFFDLLKANLSEGLKEKLRYRIDYRGSDHSAFLPKGVTCISLRTGNVRTGELDDEHPEYHKPGDDTEIIDPKLLQEVADYNLELLEFLADTQEDLLAPIHHSHFIHKDSRVVDMHCDTIGRHLEGEDLSKDNSSGHIDIPKLKQGAVDLQVFACFVGPPGDELEKWTAAKRAFDQIDAVHELVENNPDDLVLIKSNDDMRELRGTRKTGVIIGIEGGYAIENDLRLLRSFHRNGVRLMTLTHWLHTDWADASGDPEPTYSGLNELGEKVVKEMNRLGMIIDVSHAHDETFWDVLAITDSPVVASHSCCRALSDHHRNLSDEMLKALAENGGVIGINYLPDFLNAENGRKMEELRISILKKYGLPEDWRELAKADPEKRKEFFQEYQVKAEELKKTLPLVDVKTIVDHIEHVIKVTGNANHVGLGSDFDGISSTPEGLEHVGKIPAITEEMVQRGISDTDIKKILGGNFLRVFNKVTKK